MSAVSDALLEMAKDVETKEQIAATASISAADPTVGEAIAYQRGGPLFDVHHVLVAEELVGAQHAEVGLLGRRQRAGHVVEAAARAAALLTARALGALGCEHRERRGLEEACALRHPASPVRRGGLEDRVAVAATGAQLEIRLA